MKISHNSLIRMPPTTAYCIRPTLESEEVDIIQVSLFHDCNKIKDSKAAQSEASTKIKFRVNTASRLWMLVNANNYSKINAINKYQQI